MKKYLLVSLVILLTLAFLLSACGTPSPSATQAPPTTQAPTTTAAATTSAPVPTTSQLATSAPAKEVALRFSIAVPPGDPHVIFMEEWAKRFSDKFKGSYRMETYSGGTLAGGADTLDAVRTGAVEIGNGITSSYGSFDSRFSVTQIPFLTANLEAQQEFVKLIWDYHAKIYEEKFNQKLLSTWTISFYDIYTTNKQVKTLEDWKNLLVGASDPLMANVVKALGASPVMYDFPDDLPSLQKGVVDGSVAATPCALAFLKYWDVCDYFAHANLMGTQLANTVNLDVWNKLPADVQANLIEEGKVYEQKCSQAFMDLFTGNLDAMKNGGMTIYEVPANERDSWAAATAQVSEDYYSLIGPEAAAFYKDCAAKANAKYPYNPLN